MTSSHYKADENKKYTEWIYSQELDCNSKASSLLLLINLLLDYNVQENKLVIEGIALDVTWGKDECYWTIPTDPEKPLQLHKVSWLEVSCRIPMKKIELKAGMSYKVEFEVSMKPESAFGWSGCPMYLLVNAGLKGNLWKATYLSLLTKNRGEAGTKRIPSDATPLIFTVSKDDLDPNSNAELNLGLFELWKGRWKGGLNIHKVIIKLAN